MVTLYSSLPVEKLPAATLSVVVALKSRNVVKLEPPFVDFSNLNKGIKP